MEKPKNKLVIIGNGFDLAHGLRTSYKDFIEWYLNGCVEQLNTQNYIDDKLIQVSWKSSSLAHTGFKKFDIERFNSLKGQERISFSMSKFLKIIFNNSNSNWVDIEMEYYKFLIEIYGNPQNMAAGSVAEPYTLESLNSDFEFIKQKLEEYLSTIPCRISKKEIAPNYEINNLFQSDFVRGFHSEEKNAKQVHYLNFNYTKTIEDYIWTETNFELNYIHGELNNKENPIVFGYGDEIDSHYKKIEDLNNNEFLKNFKSFAYFKTDNYQKLLRFIDSEPYDIEILGHSCGLSDRVLLNTLFEHDNCQSIKIHYYEHEKGNDFTTKTQEISRHFKDKAKMRKRVLDFTQCKPLVKFKKL
jgi:Bacteriophage abortive infection AbiH